MHEEITDEEKVDWFVKCNICGQLCDNEETFEKHFKNSSSPLKKMTRLNCDFISFDCRSVKNHREGYHEENLARLTRVSDSLLSNCCRNCCRPFGSNSA